MKIFPSSTVVKFLSVFTVSLLGAWLNTASWNQMPQMPLTSSDSLPLSQEVSSHKSLLGLPSIANEIVLAAFNAYIWFIFVMILLEVSIAAFSLLRKHSYRIINQMLTLANSRNIHSIECQSQGQQAEISQLKKFAKCFLKTILTHTICYFLFTITFFALCFLCTPVQHETSLQQTMPLIQLTKRSLGQVSLDLPRQDDLIEGAINPSSERFLQSLNSYMTQLLFQTETQVNSIAMSSNSNIVFLAMSPEDPGSSLMQILDISNKTAPIFLGSIFVPYAFSLVLSSDEQTMLVSAINTVYLVNVSNLMAPVNIASFSLGTNQSISSLSLSTDGTIAFILVSPKQVQDDSPYQILSLNISDAASPQIVNQINYTYEIFTLQVYESSMYIQDSEGLHIYNISDIMNPIITANLSLPLSNANQTGIVNFANDYQSLFLIYPTYIQIFNISDNIVSPLGTLFPQYTSIGPLTSVLQSPDSIHIFIIAGSYLQIYDISNPNSPIPLVQTSIYLPYCVLVSPDTRTLLVGTVSSFSIVELNLNIQATQPFDLQSNILGIINITNISTSGIQQIALTPDSNTLYISTWNFNGAPNSSLVAIDVSNPASYAWFPPFNISEFISQMSISPDGNSLFTITASYDTTLSNFEIYNLSNTELMSSITFDSFYTVDTESMTLSVSQDGNTALVIEGQTNFLLLDISNRTNISISSNTSFPSSVVSALVLSADAQTAFILRMPIDQNGNYKASILDIYDISNPSSPLLTSSFTNISTFTAAIILSVDGNTAFVLSEPSQVQNDYCTINVIDISSLASPTLTASMSIPQACTEAPSPPIVIPLMPTGQALFIPFYSMLVAIDVSMPVSPRIMSYYNISAINIIASPDYSTLYVASEDIVMVISLVPENVLYIEPETIPLGDIFSAPLNLLTRNSLNTYDARMSNYKFADISMYTPNFEPISPLYTAIPNWLNFDQNGGVITFSPNLPSQIGSYSLYSTLSTQMSNTTFLDAGIVNTTDDSLNLLVTLVSLGYVDNQGFLTSSFDPTQPLLLGTQYMNNELQIRQALFNYSDQAWISFYITPSLDLALPNSPQSPMTIDTLSLEPLNLAIVLTANSTLPQFVSLGYSFTASFSNNNTAVSMVKALLDINTALSELIIFLNGTDSCDGNITITDGLNPTLNQFIPSISSYFRTSSPPSIDPLYFQSQLSKVSTKTGEQFVIQFDSSTFTDTNNQPLTLSLEMQDSTLEVPNWLEVKDFTLIGTPPDQLTGRTVELNLIVSNQYQSSQIQFTLDIGISFEYGLKQVFTYGGALITLIGLVVYAPRIYNILCKKRYRYPKDFYIRVGQEIGSKSLYPIVFAKESILESKIIMNHLDKKLSIELKSTSKSEIAVYFTSPNSSNQIDKAKLIQAIEETADEIMNKLKLYTPVVTAQKELINQLIINNFALRLLDLEEEKRTKSAFSLIKKDIFHLVDLDKCLPDGVCSFAVNKSRLHSKLKDYRVKAFTPSEDKDKEESISLSNPNPDSKTDIILESERSHTAQKSLKTALVSVDIAVNARPKSSANIDLLIAAIEAYAFNNHIIDANVLEVDVIARQRQDNVWPVIDCIRRFMKWDLKLVGFSKKRLIGYGIEYNIQGDSVSFYGNASQKIKDKTLLVQIITLRGKILRELWINGVDFELEKELLAEGAL